MSSVNNHNPNTKTEILAAIAKTDDHNLKMVLLLMLGIMEEIGVKIDRIYSDKDLLKQSVLNGHADIHHDDHEWIKKRKEEYEATKAFVTEAKPSIDWVKLKMENEKDTNKTLKTGFLNVLMNVGEKLLWLASGMVVFAVTHGGITL